MFKEGTIKMWTQMCYDTNGISATNDDVNVAFPIGVIRDLTLWTANTLYGQTLET